MMTKKYAIVQKTPKTIITKVSKLLFSFIKGKVASACNEGW
jgi:hypothetical protein